MKHKVISCLTTAALSFLMSFGSVCCVATGLHLRVEFSPLAMGCLLLSLLFSLAYTVPKGGRFALGFSALVLILLFYNEDFQKQVLSLSKHVITFYSNGYGFAVPDVLQDVPSASHMLPLLVVAGLIDLAAAWTMLHRYPVAMTVFTAVLPLVSCFVVVDTVPEIWALTLWITGLGLLVMTQTVRIDNPVSANRLTAILLIPLLIAISLMYLFIPQKHYSPPITLDSMQDSLGWMLDKIPFVGQTSDGRLVLNFGGDLSDTVSLNGLGDRNPNASPVLEVTASYSGNIYLRIRDYDVYTATSWTSTERSETFTAPSGFFADRQTVDIRVLGNRAQKLIPYYPADPETTKNGIVPISADQREYRYEVAVLPSNWDALWSMYLTNSTFTVGGQYLQLPESTKIAAQSHLTKISGLENANTVEAANRIGRYVCLSAEYSTTPDKTAPKDIDFAMWFLKSADEGYCVHFATATTVLLRAYGIPARYVEGYLLTAQANELTEVTQDMAHAWVEYYVPNVGWVVLDATPGFGGVDTTPDHTEPSATEPPTEVTEPSENTEPPEDTTPTESTEPSEDTTPTESTEPSEDTTPTESTEPSEDTTPTENTEPSEDTTPTENTEPSEDTTPTEPSEDTTPTEPSENTTPTEGSEPSTTTVSLSSDKKPAAPPPEPTPQWLVNLLIGLAITAGGLMVTLGQWFLRRWLNLRRLGRGSNGQQVVARYQQTLRICNAMKTPMPESLTALAEKAVFSQHDIQAAELTEANALYLHHFRQLQNGSWYKKLYWRFILALY